MFAVCLADLLTIWCEQRHHNIYPSLVNHHVQVLTGDHRDLVGMRLTTRELSLNGRTKFQRVTFLSALCRAAFTCACLHSRRHWPKVWRSRQPDPNEEVDNSHSPKQGLDLCNQLAHQFEQLLTA